MLRHQEGEIHSDLSIGGGFLEEEDLKMDLKHEQ